MSLVNRLLVVAATLSVVFAVDVALTPCYSVYYLKNLTQEFKFDSALNTANANLSDCVFTLMGPLYSSLKLFLHDIVEMDPVTGAAMMEPLCQDGAVRMYEMTSDGDLYVSDAVCQSLANSTEVNTTYNVVVVTSTITRGKFNLTVTVVPGPIPTESKVVEDKDRITDAPPDKVVEDTTTTATTSFIDENDATTEGGDEAMVATENDVVDSTTAMMEEEATIANTEEPANEEGYETTTEDQSSIVTTDDTITVEAENLMEGVKESNNNVMKVAKPRVKNA